jgi:hypothetical protein
MIMVLGILSAKLCRRKRRNDVLKKNIYSKHAPFCYTNAEISR